MVLLAGIGIFAACGGAEQDAKVTFMVMGESDWGVYKTIGVNEDGTVTLPDNPQKDLHTFRDWYTDKNFAEGTEFKNVDIKKSITVYARLVADTVTVHVDGVIQGEKDLKDLVNGTYAPTKDNLTHDAWYTDADGNVEYQTGDDATNLYGFFKAKITFDNGHEVVFETLVTPETAMQKPSDDDIIKNYMDKNEGLIYQDESGNRITDFTNFKPDKNMTVTVKWSSGFTYKENPATGKYAAIGLKGSADFTRSAISFLHEVKLYDYSGTFLQDIEVESLSFPIAQVRGITGTTLYTRLTTILIDEGIESIWSLPGSDALSKLQLPSTLKVIDNSFNSATSLASVELPEGLEVFSNSFLSGDYLTIDRTKSYDFDIELPSTVKHLSQPPKNLVFTNNDNFYKDDDGRIFQKGDARGDILISAFDVKNNALEIPEGVKGIQVSAFHGFLIDTIVLPKSFAFVSFNADKADYPEYYAGKVGTVFSFEHDMMWNSQYSENPIGNLELRAHTIVRNLEAVTVYIKQTNPPNSSSITSLRFTTKEEISL